MGPLRAPTAHQKFGGEPPPVAAVETVWGDGLGGVVAVSDDGGVRLRQRFHADGTPCTNQTDYADGWCREPGCPGFQRADDSTAPEPYGSPKGTRKHIEETGHIRLDGLSADDVPNVRITTRAVDSFRFHHGGGIRETEVQLQAMLEDFLLMSARMVMDSGYVRLARHRFMLMLSPAMDAVVGYSTVHRERTWEQVKADVPSRIRRKSPRRDEFASAPEPGPPMPLDRLAETVDPASIFLTARVRRSFVKIEGLPIEEWDEDLDSEIRSTFARFRSGILTQRDNGMFEATVDGRVWLMSGDAQTLIGVKRGPANAPV